MAVLSRLAAVRNVLKTPVRSGSGGAALVQNRPSRWEYDLFKDQLHFYIMLGAIPLGLLITFVNLMKGPAELKPIPEGYVPEEYEYYKSPITRWMMKHVYDSYQQKYEKHLCNVWEETKKQNMMLLRKEVHRQMKVHQDYKGWYTREHHAEYLRMSMNNNKSNLEARGFRSDL